MAANFLEELNLDSGKPQSRSDIMSALSDDKDDKSDDDKSDDDKDTKDDLDLLGDSDDEESDDEDDSKEDKDSEEDDEEEDDLDADNEEEIELDQIPTRAQIKAKYPNIFKEFKALDHIIQREKQFATVFSTIKEAKDARAEIAEYNSFKNEIFDGSIEGVLKSLKSSDEKAYSKLTNNLLETVNKVDPAAAITINNKVLKGTLKFVYDSCLSELKDNPDSEDAKQLSIAVRLLNKAIYRTTNITGPESIAQNDKADPEKEKFESEKAEYAKTRLGEAYQDVMTRTNGRIRAAVERQIDTKNIIPAYVKGKLVDDVLKALDAELSSDTRFRSNLDRLWRESLDNKYSTASKDKIHEALIRRSKTSLQSIMRAKRAEALKGLSTTRRAVDKDSDDETPRNTRDNKGDPKKKITSSRREDDRSKPRAGESNREFLMRD